MIYDDQPATFPDGYPMSDCALYFGWYADAVAGPFTQLEFRFVPGAVAVHIHSFSASTLRNENANWVVELIRSVLRTSADAPAAPLLKKLEADARAATSAVTPGNARDRSE